MIMMYEITDIKWERANLILKVNRNIDGVVYLVKGKSKIELPYKDDEIKISIYNVPEGSSITQGKWRVQIIKEELITDEELREEYFTEEFQSRNIKLIDLDSNKKIAVNYITPEESDEDEPEDNQSENEIETQNEMLIDLENTIVIDLHNPEGRTLIKRIIDNITVIPELVSDLDDKSRVFRYRKNFYALLITFSINGKFTLFLTADYMMKNRKYKKYYRFAEKKKLKTKIELFLRIMTIRFLNFLYRMIYFFSKKDKVLFLTENANELNSNLKYLYEYLKPRYKTRIYAKDIYKGKKSLFRTIIQKNAELLALSRSKYVFVDNYVSLLTIIKPVESQVITQLWHAGVGFKAIGYARFGRTGSPHPFIAGHRKYTYSFVDKEEFVDIYKEVFGAKTEIFNISGMPRLDGFTDKIVIEKTINRLYEEEPLLKNKKIILFSPTYRGTGSNSANYDYTKIDLSVINDYCEKNNFLFVVKMHPFIKKKIEIPEEYQNNIIDLSEMNINELIYIADIMITDYSSCAYEYSFFNRPLVFYRYDKELYEYLRPMHTVDSFTKEQYETTDFESLMEVLNKLKDIDIKDRFKNIAERNTNSCEVIEKIVFEGNKDDNSN